MKDIHRLLSLILVSMPLLGTAQTQSNSGSYGDPQSQSNAGSYGNSQSQTNNGSYGNTQGTSTYGNDATYSSGSTRMVVPSGTMLHVRVNENLSSETAQSGDRFTGTLSEAVTTNGSTVFPRGADVAGRVLSATPSGRLTDSGTLELTLSSVRFNGQTVNFASAPLVMKGESHNKSNATKVGGGAALGAIIGGIAGGGKGAAIGATVGAGAGAAGAAATGKKPATVESEAVLNFTTGNDTTVYVAQNQQSQNSSQDQMGNAYPGRQADDQPVLRRHDGSTANNAGNSSNTNNVGIPSATTSDRNQEDGIYTNNSTANPTSFTLRDRRVIRSCVAANRTSLSSSAMTRAVGISAMARGTVLPVSVQRRVSSLPLACERQLAPEANNTERVIYNRQVMLIDNNARILDAFSLDYGN